MDHIGNTKHPCGCSFATTACLHIDLWHFPWFERNDKGADAGCRVHDIQTRLNDVITDPALLAHVTKFHEATVHSIYEATETTNRRKRKRVTMPGPAEERPDVAALKVQMDGTQLKCWP